MREGAQVSSQALRMGERNAPPRMARQVPEGEPVRLRLGSPLWVPWAGWVRREGYCLRRHLCYYVHASGELGIWPG
jgi:hypothetical protein